MYFLDKVDTSSRKQQTMRTNRLKRVTSLTAAGLLVLALGGCTSATAANSSSAKSASSVPVSQTATTVSTTASASTIDTSDIFSDRDMEQTADTSSATNYTVQSGEDITISEAGVYVLTGSAQDVTVKVDAADDAKVQIVLDNVSITNEDAPAIYVVSADKVFVTTAEGSTNTLSTTGTFTADGDTNTDAVIFSKDDLTLNGLGTLEISSTDNGVTSKDDLTITGGTYFVTSVHHAFEAHDSIAIADGTFKVNAQKDAFHSEYDEDDTVGYVYIADGDFTIDAGDDGIQGTTITQIDGGSFTINAVEAIEGTVVQINGGTIDISASDDGINASNKSTAYSPTIEINDGNITITMGSGDTDAIDANGSIVINGGTIDITANSPFDYDTTGELNGGTVTVNGSQVTELTNQMMGGPGGGQMGGQGGGPGSSAGGPGGGKMSGNRPGV